MSSLPTFHAPRGDRLLREKKNIFTTQTSVRALPAQMSLKFRQPGQNTQEEVKQKNEQENEAERQRVLEQAKLFDAESDTDSAQSDQESHGKQKEESSEYSSDEESEDDEAELMKELEKIKRERQAERERKAQEEVANGNPLLLQQQEFTVKRRWDEDVVFKNQARGLDTAQKKRFINDTVRSDFHKKFMNRYIH